MASKDSDFSNLFEQLNEAVICCICTDVFKDPKVLPCIHTFCLTCLEKTASAGNKKPGDTMPCPICRRDFSIPTGKFFELQTNFFVERLIEMAKMLRPNSGSMSCDACLEGRKSDINRKIGLAEIYCENCKERLCKKCSNHHRNFKITRDHKLIAFNELLTDQGSIIERLVPDVCDLHDQKILDIYCKNCKTVLCYQCFVENHKHHDGSAIKTVGDGFRKEIQGTVDSLLTCASAAQTRKANLEKEKMNTLETTRRVEEKVIRRRDNLKELVDKHALDLLQALGSLKQTKLKEIQAAADDADMYLTSLESYSLYCKRIIAQGSSSDICRSVDGLITKGDSLQQQSRESLDTEIRSFDVFYCDSNKELLFENECPNMIGSIAEGGVQKIKPKGTDDILRKLEQTLEEHRKKKKVPTATLR